MQPLPDQLEVRPIPAFDAAVSPPGSKSLTNRCLLLAALAHGTSTLSNVLLADDSRLMMTALSELGFRVELDEGEQIARIEGRGGELPRSSATLHLGNAGTAMRFLTAACCLGDGPYTLDGVRRMRQRPIAELVDALRALDARAEYLAEPGYPPHRVWREELAGGRVTMKPTLSSQFISALLHVGPCLRWGLTLAFDGPITSRPYVEMTLATMQRFGAGVRAAADFRQIVCDGAGEGGDGAVGGAGDRAGGGYEATDLRIEPDASGASYFLAAAAVVPGSRVRIEGLGSDSVQGDARFARVLAEMGCEVEQTAGATTLIGPKGEALRGIDIDLNHMPDVAQTLACVALFADGRTTIRNVGNLRVKETDRLAALRHELTKLGATVTIRGDDLLIDPPPGGRVQPAAVGTYDDHRMAMAFSIVGLRAPGVVIDHPGCVAKSYPNFFDDLNALAPAQRPAVGEPSGAGRTARSREPRG